MRHGISTELWEDYLEDSLTAAERSQIEAHLNDCAGCRELAVQMAQCTLRLHDAAILFDDAPLLSAEELEAAWQAALAQLGADETPVRQRLDELEAAMAVLCGSHTAVRALQAAAADSPAHSLTRLTRENWEPFLCSLLGIARALCGRTGARLIMESGQL